MHDANIIRIGSVVPNGVGGPNAGALDLIYSTLLKEYRQDRYNYIGINQIGDDLDEFIMKTGKNDIHINIRYPATKNFASKSTSEQNRIRLDVVHNALSKIAIREGKLDIDKLNQIREKILAHNFNFQILYKEHENKMDKSVSIRIIINPGVKVFKIYTLVIKNGKEKCKFLIYSGKPTDFYFDDLFFYGKWKSGNEFVISGKRSEMGIHIFIDECKIEFVNSISNTSQAPLFELFKSDADKTKSLVDYINSLNPTIATILKYSFLKPKNGG